MKIAPEISEFFVEGGNQEVSHALLHITEPSSPEEEKKGYFFALAEIENGSAEQVEHLQKMIDDLEGGYYETDAVGQKDPFETALEFINRRGHRILDNSRALVHCFAGVIRGQEIVFAYHGSPSVTLLYRGKDGLSATPVIDGADSASTQLFSSILQGRVNAGDFFVVATPRVAEYFSSDRLAKILSGRSPKETTEHIEKVLRDLRGKNSFAGLILSLPERRFAQAQAIKKEEESSVVDSVTKMVNAEKTTDELLSPSLLGDTKKKLQTILSKDKEAGAQSEIKENETNYRPRRGRAQSFTTTILVSLGKALVIGSIGILTAVKSTLIWFITFLRNLFFAVTNYRQKRRDTIANWKRTWHHRRMAFKALPLLSKLLLIGTILFIGLFIGTILYIRWNETRQAKTQAYATSIHDITGKIEEAEGSIIYGNTDQAFTLLREASNLLSQLPQDTPEEKEKYGQLSGEVDNSLRKIRKFVVVSPSVFFSLASVQPQVAADKLVRIDDTLLAYGPNDSSLYAVDMATQKGEIKDHSTITGLHAATTPKEKDHVVFLTKDNGVAEYDKTRGVLTASNISFPVDGVSLSDAFVYNQRLYTLDSGTKTIYRHSRTQTGYDQGVAWSKDGQEQLATGAALAIDGDVYVLHSNGITRYTNGRSAEFTITGLDPALQNPTAIWTYSDVNNIYILEPANKRVIVADKNGKLIAQYTSPEWQNPTGMVVMENEKKIFVLDNNIIYQFTL